MNSKIMSDLLVSIIKDIVINGAKVISLKLFEDLDKDKSIEIYNFLCNVQNLNYCHLLLLFFDNLLFHFD